MVNHTLIKHQALGYPFVYLKIKDNKLTLDFIFLE